MEDSSNGDGDFVPVVERGRIAKAWFIYSAREIHKEIDAKS
jgi:hypothetical protein